jgi:diguanylate cyclase (GGDEF)-like protein
MLAYTLCGIVALHAILLLAWWHHFVAASRLFTAAVPVAAAFCSWWRARKVPVRERSAWRWLSLALLLWAAGQVVETFLGQSTSASVLSVDTSDFLYIAAAFPLLLAISSTKVTESVRAVFLLDSALVVLALVLTYVQLFKMALVGAQASTAMLRIYAAECVLLAFSALLRLASWSTLEERRRIGLLCRVLWMYLPIELGMDFATSRWNLQAGTLLDLLWSVPFLYAGWQALNLPMDERSTHPRAANSRRKLLVESLCPLLFTVGIFALAASIAGQYPALALTAVFLLLLIQGIQAGLVQLNYLGTHETLLERELELRAANTALERLSMLDPLTGVPNRRRFTGALEDAWKHAIRARESIAVLMIDVDFFKGVNDLHGHSYGDECLIVIARLLGQAGRSSDLLARYGGEEFVLLLPDTGATGALTVAERIQHAVSIQGMVNDASPFNHRLTVSVGLAVTAPLLGMHPAELVEIADKALYEAKRKGKNRICSRTL